MKVLLQVQFPSHFFYIFNNLKKVQNTNNAHISLGNGHVVGTKYEKIYLILTIRFKYIITLFCF